MNSGISEPVLDKVLFENALRVLKIDIPKERALATYQSNGASAETGTERRELIFAK